MNIINHTNNWPKYLVYDNGCHLEQFIGEHLKETTLRSQILRKTKIVVDRFHFLEHKDSHTYCRENCDPNLFDDLKDINTESSEQTNYWLSGYKHATKHMNDIHFYFFTYIICEEYNKTKLIYHLYEQKVKNKIQIK